MKTILVLFGGCSTEYEVSLHSAYAVLSHMDPARYTPLAVGITREGQWLCYTGDLSRLEDGTWQQAADCIPCTPLVEREAHALLLLDGSGRRLLFDAVFPVLHGKNGEDGTVQGLFELAGVPVKVLVAHDRAAHLKAGDRLLQDHGAVVAECLLHGGGQLFRPGDFGDTEGGTGPDRLDKHRVSPMNILR